MAAIPTAVTAVPIAVRALPHATSFFCHTFFGPKGSHTLPPERPPTISLLPPSPGYKTDPETFPLCGQLQAEPPPLQQPQDPVTIFPSHPLFLSSDFLPAAGTLRAAPVSNVAESPEPKAVSIGDGLDRLSAVGMHLGAWWLQGSVRTQGFTLCAQPRETASANVSSNERIAARSRWPRARRGHVAGTVLSGVASPRDTHSWQEGDVGGSVQMYSGQKCGFT